MHQFTRVQFSRFKAFKAFRLDIRHFNILVGPNNAGKSTILTAFRILASGIRRALARKATMVRGPQGVVHGYELDLSLISVAEENIFYNYEADEPASVEFHLSNQNSLTLYFPEQGVCRLIPNANGKIIASPSNFKKHFDCEIGFVPILGPVEHQETLFEKEAARLALFNYRAARNFRNIWYHYPEKFDAFRLALQETWQGMDIERPEVDRSHGKPILRMYCPEDRIPRELFWSGFGFQVWCQMLTHIIQSSDVSLFLIDEPDIYLHSELQRQLLALLRNLGPDVLLATHSTEIIGEAETDEIVLVNKHRHSGRRIKSSSQIEEVFSALGSNMNPILTQLAKTRRALFVEGKDFQVLGKFARKIGALNVGHRKDFAVVPVNAFSPERIRSLKAGMEVTLGTPIVAAAILDRDYRCPQECEAVIEACAEFCQFVVVHNRKEVENFLLVPAAIDRAMTRGMAERSQRSGIRTDYSDSISSFLEEHCEERKSYVLSQILSERRRFGRSTGSSEHETAMTERALNEFGKVWGEFQGRLNVVPGKDTLGAVNKFLRDKYGSNVSPMGIIDAMSRDEVPSEVVELVEMLKKFSAAKAQRPS
ncbi:hypothetical protein BFX40_02425 [Mesorhizobium sp. SEMIA 3007]|uniref:ATP-dependent nuclease n=1 Tax=Mesorhizobium sp. SEMIA 3007 TaxID=1862350 RepID=UPI00083D0D36|nr:AAA family ATPase [Mesorhizobium sp. SEMIA 3007]ODA91855.1 hypothetical protein BFX40_02425 [Mesorhizobium sp. SEMIA 3007]